MKTNLKRTLVALIPLATLVIILVVNISIYGADSILGASQIALLASAMVCVGASMWLYKTPWKEFEKAISGNIGEIATAIIILLLIGAISGTWIMSGVVPTLICYGIKAISPKVFLLTACVLCALVSVMTGSSWTTIATVGVALIGIGHAQGFSDAVTAGAIISGAYFGDKISPLSDTTVLASSFNRVDLFTHIRYLMITTVPSIVICLIIFTVIGLTHGTAAEGQMGFYTSVLESKFRITPWLLLVPAFSFFLIWRKVPAIIVLALSVIAGAVAALFFQPGIVREIGSAVSEGSAAKVYFTGIMEMVYNSVTLETGSGEINRLVASRGMLGMLNTVYLIICAMVFGSCMKASGMIADLSRILSPLTRSRTGLVGATVVTGTALNGIVADQYLAIILSSSLYKDSFEKQGYEPRLLSRSVEDSATVTSPLFPWSSCGMTQATILSVPTLAYAPYCFFNIISPLMSILVSAAGWKIFRKKSEL